ncbi:alpha/beta hydrolase family protein, partial [Allosphingosinicella sp.]|uniref:alpha/beta hydrolase family protein n=1 Tax=Allosphingosinicella sp. TaxID=2823234 RepID=UPI002EE6988E
PGLELCAGCDVLQTSVGWSASGRYLSFYAKGPGQPWSDAAFRIHDRVSGSAIIAPLAGLRAHVVRRELDMNVGSAWLGDAFVVRAEEAGSSGSAVESAAHWYRLGGAAPANLTAAFQGVRPEVIAVSNDRLVMLAAREAWAVDAEGNRTNLTEAIAEPVGLWRLPHSPIGPLNDLRPVDTIVLDSRADPSSPRRLLFVDLGSGAIVPIAAPSSTSEVLAVSPATRQVAFFDSAHNVGRLVVAGAQGRHTIAEINRHLAGVEGGRPLRIDHQGPDGSSRMSWLLLPPGHRPGQRVPAIVNVYPGNGNAASWSRWRLDSTTPLNDHILAARGYAILYPSLPSAQTLPRDPLENLADSLLAAVDAAIAEGYIDPDRLAVQGHSFGGYAAAAVIGQTNRFKAAVAQSAPYNLYSLYGQIDPRRRLAVEQDGLNLYNVSLLETGHGGMGAPPWRDSERYLRNSPISQVEGVRTPIMLIHGDLDYVPMAQAEEYFTALTRLDRDAIFLRYFGEDHILNSPANIRDMWQRLFGWYERHLGPPAATVAVTAPATR